MLHADTHILAAGHIVIHRMSERIFEISMLAYAILVLCVSVFMFFLIVHHHKVLHIIFSMLLSQFTD